MVAFRELPLSAKFRIRTTAWGGARAFGCTICVTQNFIREKGATFFSFVKSQLVLRLTAVTKHGTLPQDDGSLAFSRFSIFPRTQAVIQKKKVVPYHPFGLGLPIAETRPVTPCSPYFSSLRAKQ